jgi:hypothetical protein
MKKVIFAILVLMLVSTVSAQADLIDMEDGTILDTDLSIMWLQDSMAAKGSNFDDGHTLDDGYLTWQSAMNWAASLESAGYDDWRLPTHVDQEMQHLYYDELNSSLPGPFLNLATGSYWTSTDAGGGYVWNFGFWGSTFKANPAGGSLAWAVRDVPPAVPEPATMLLLGSGLIGFAGARRKFKK